MPRRISRRQIKLEEKIWLGLACGGLIAAISACSVLLYQRIDEIRSHSEEQIELEHNGNRICYLDKSYFLTVYTMKIPERVAY